MAAQRVRVGGRVVKRWRARYADVVRGIARLGWVLAMVGSGCHGGAMAAPPDAAEGTTSWPEVPETGFAVLPWGTQLYVEPRYGAISVRLAQWMHTRPPWPSDGNVVRIVGSRDGFVEVAPLLAGGPAHCVTPLAADGFDVRLYVSPWSLAPVLTGRFQASFEDGSSIELRPGAAVRSIRGDPQGRFGVAAAGIQVRAALPPEAVGSRYEEPEPQTMPTARNWDRIGNRSLYYDGGWPLELAHQYDVAIQSVLPLTGRYRVEVVSACARVIAMSEAKPREQVQEKFHFDFGLGASEVHLPTGGALDAQALLNVEGPPPPPEPEPSEEFAFDGGEIMGQLIAPEVSHELVFEAGAPIFVTAGGPPAGTLDVMRVFAEDHWAAGDRLCFRTSFGARFAPMLAVCLDAAESRWRSPETDPHDFGMGMVEPLELRVSPGLDEALVGRALRTRRHELRKCYDEALAKKPDLFGEVELALDTDADGAVDKARLRSTWLGPVVDCAREVALGWTMPPTADGGAGRITFRVKLVPR